MNLPASNMADIKESSSSLDMHNKKSRMRLPNISATDELKVSTGSSGSIVVARSKNEKVDNFPQDEKSSGRSTRRQSRQIASGVVGERFTSRISSTGVEDREANSPNLGPTAYLNSVLNKNYMTTDKASSPASDRTYIDSKNGLHINNGGNNDLSSQLVRNLSSRSVHKKRNRDKDSLSSNKPAEVFRKDLISAMKIPDNSQLLSEEYWVMSDSWRMEWEKGVQVPVNPEVLMKINVKIVPKDSRGDFRMPRKLIKATPDIGDRETVDLNVLADSTCRYDLDETDVSLLEVNNEERLKTGYQPLDEFTMEIIMEELETQCHENMQLAIKTKEGLGIEYDENIVCDICRSPDCEEGNEMVFCDGCNLCVHQACYGILNVPDGSWLCKPCALGIRGSAVCILCGKKGGAMKSTRSGNKWAHVSCALWIPEITIADPERMEPITKVSHIPSSRWSLLCVVCKDRVGACIQCSVRNCVIAYHVTCAVEQRFDMITDCTTVAGLNSVDNAVIFRSYCHKHSKNSKMNCQDEESGLKTEEEKRSDRQRRIAELEEEFFTLVKCEAVANALNIPVETATQVTEYWKLKRRANFNRPLITPKQDEGKALEEAAETGLQRRLRMFTHLRQDLERVRNLCYMIGRREKIKRSAVKNMENVFLAQIKHVENRMSHNRNFDPKNIVSSLAKFGMPGILRLAKEESKILAETKEWSQRRCSTGDTITSSGFSSKAPSRSNSPARNSLEKGENESSLDEKKELEEVSTKRPQPLPQLSATVTQKLKPDLSSEYDTPSPVNGLIVPSGKRLLKKQNSTNDMKNQSDYRDRRKSFTISEKRNSSSYDILERMKRKKKLGTEEGHSRPCYNSDESSEGKCDRTNVKGNVRTKNPKVFRYWGRPELMKSQRGPRSSTSDEITVKKEICKERHEGPSKLSQKDRTKHSANGNVTPESPSTPLSEGIQQDIINEKLASFQDANRCRRLRSQDSTSDPVALQPNKTRKPTGKSDKSSTEASGTNIVGVEAVAARNDCNVFLSSGDEKSDKRMTILTETISETTRLDKLSPNDRTPFKRKHSDPSRKSSSLLDAKKLRIDGGKRTDDASSRCTSIPVRRKSEIRNNGKRISKMSTSLPSDTTGSSSDDFEQRRQRSLNGRSRISSSSQTDGKKEASTSCSRTLRGGDSTQTRRRKHQIAKNGRGALAPSCDADSNQDSENLARVETEFSITPKQPGQELEKTNSLLPVSHQEQILYPLPSSPKWKRVGSEEPMREGPQREQPVLMKQSVKPTSPKGLRWLPLIDDSDNEHESNFDPVFDIPKRVGTPLEQEGYRGDMDESDSEMQGTSRLLQKHYHHRSSSSRRRSSKSKTSTITINVGNSDSSDNDFDLSLDPGRSEASDRLSRQCLRSISNTDTISHTGQQLANRGLDHFSSLNKAGDSQISSYPGGQTLENDGSKNVNAVGGILGGLKSELDVKNSTSYPTAGGLKSPSDNFFDKLAALSQEKNFKDPHLEMPFLEPQISQREVLAYRTEQVPFHNPLFQYNATNVWQTPLQTPGYPIPMFYGYPPLPHPGGKDLLALSGMKEITKPSPPQLPDSTLSPESVVKTSSSVAVQASVSDQPNTPTAPQNIISEQDSTNVNPHLKDDDNEWEIVKDNAEIAQNGNYQERDHVRNYKKHKKKKKKKRNRLRLPEGIESEEAECVSGEVQLPPIYGAIVSKGHKLHSETAELSQETKQSVEEKTKGSLIIKVGKPKAMQSNFPILSKLSHRSVMDCSERVFTEGSPIFCNADSSGKLVLKINKRNIDMSQTKTSDVENKIGDLKRSRSSDTSDSSESSLNSSCDQEERSSDPTDSSRDSSPAARRLYVPAISGLKMKFKISRSNSLADSKYNKVDIKDHNLSQKNNRKDSKGIVRKSAALRRLGIEADSLLEYNEDGIGKRALRERKPMKSAQGNQKKKLPSSDKESHRNKSLKMVSDPSRKSRFKSLEKRNPNDSQTGAFRTFSKDGDKYSPPKLRRRVSPHSENKESSKEKVKNTVHRKIGIVKPSRGRPLKVKIGHGSAEVNTSTASTDADLKPQSKQQAYKPGDRARFAGWSTKTSNVKNISLDSSAMSIPTSFPQERDLSSRFPSTDSDQQFTSPPRVVSPSFSSSGQQPARHWKKRKVHEHEHETFLSEHTVNDFANPSIATGIASRPPSLDADSKIKTPTKHSDKIPISTKLISSFYGTDKVPVKLKPRDMTNPKNNENSQKSHNANTDNLQSRSPNSKSEREKSSLNSQIPRKSHVGTGKELFQTTSTVDQGFFITSPKKDRPHFLKKDRPVAQPLSSISESDSRSYLKQSQTHLPPSPCKVSSQVLDTTQSPKHFVPTYPVDFAFGSGLGSLSNFKIPKKMRSQTPDMN